MVKQIKFKKRSRRERLHLTIISALFCAILAVFAQIAVPTPFGVSFTLQSFAVMLSGFYLPPLYAFLTTLSYLLLGLIGLPVFSGFSGGLSHLFSFSGGFLIGFLLLALFCSLSKLFRAKVFSFCVSFLGLLFCYLLGILWFCFVAKQNFFGPFLYFSFIFLIKDTLLLVLSFFIYPLIKSPFYE